MKLNSIIGTIVFLFQLSTLSPAQMVSIPSGTFNMGNMSPPHTVSVSKFRIDQHETSFAQYDSCVQQGKCTKAHYDDGQCLMWTSKGIRRVRVPHTYRSPHYSVVCVTWHQANQFCKYKGKRLPTEAEWEYAALAQSQNIYSWGSTPLPDSTTCTNDSHRGPMKPGRFKPNTWGLYDMTGNVWEWTRDRYVKDFQSVSTKINPTGPTVGRFRVIKGGGWYSKAHQLEIKNRHWFLPSAGEVSIGIRCAK